MTKQFKRILFQLLFTTALVWGQRKDNKNDIPFCDPVSKEFVEIPAHFMKENITQSFRPVTQNVTCPAESGVKQLITSLDNTSFFFYSTGEIIVPNKEYILRSEYCVKSINPESIEISTCEVICGETHACVHKCCPPHQIIDISVQHTSSCVFSPAKMWEPVFYSTHEGCGTRIETKNVKYHLITVSGIAIKGNFFPYKHVHVNHIEHGISKFDGFRFRLMIDGQLMSQGVEGKWQSIKPGEFCIDGMMGYIGSAKHVYKRLEDQIFVSITDSNTTDEDYNYDNEEITKVNNQLAEYFYIPLMLIGAMFLLLTSVLYIFIWEKHNIHGWTIFAFVTTMFFMFVLLATSKIFAVYMTDDFGGTFGCKTVGVLAHFFYLSTICWLTVINLDLWLTFRNVKPSSGKSQSVTRFIFYSLFACGIPFLIVSFAVTVDLTYHDSIGDGTECEPPFILPLYGQQKCYLQDDSVWFYVYIPMAILLTCNILTFSSTVFSLCMYRSQTRNATAGTSTQNESLVLFGKLFIVTGLSWVLELISSIAPDLWWFWIVFDGYNLLQTVLIFIIFALKREHLLFLYHKYPGIRFLLVPIMRTRCCRTQSFDPEKTDMTAVPFDRNSKVHFRKGSNLSTSSCSRRDS